MPRKPAKTEDAWSNRFQTPTVEALAESLQDPAATLFASARTRLDELEETICEIRWLGVPWRWSLVYALKHDPDEVVAYLVPAPTRPQLCIPLHYDDLERLTPKRLSRTIRDGIVYAAEVAGTRWASWDLQSETQVDEILSLARTKHQSRAAAT